MAVVADILALDSDIAPTIATHLKHLHLRMCAVVSKSWNKTFASQRIWKSLCAREYGAACDLISRSQHPDVPICWTKVYMRLNDLTTFDRPSKPQINPSLLEARLEIGFARKEVSAHKEKNISLLRINGFTLVKERSDVDPQYQTCLLRGEAEGLDAGLIERLKENTKECSLRAYILDPVKQKLALLHVDDPHSSFLGAELSKDQVLRYRKQPYANITRRSTRRLLLPPSNRPMQAEYAPCALFCTRIRFSLRPACCRWSVGWMDWQCPLLRAARRVAVAPLRRGRGVPSTILIT